ncbi:MAG: DUF1571 domain-containing protein [Phycisphaerae bacterium]
MGSAIRSRWPGLAMVCATYVALGGCGLLRREPPVRKDDSETRPTLSSNVLPTRHFELKTESAAALARRDPRALLRRALDHYDREIRDYTCTFSRRERVHGRLSKQQVIHVRFREKPYSVRMLWVRNAKRARRALYVEGRHRGSGGQELFIVDPAGAIARALFGTVAIPVHGKRATASSRHTIDQFGFRWTLRRILQVNEKADRAGVLGLRFAGEGSINGRPTFILERYLPEANPAYDNAFLVLHLDQTWLIPLSVRAYADHKGSVLNEAYTYSAVHLNPGLGEASFLPCCGKSHKVP